MGGLALPRHSRCIAYAHIALPRKNEGSTGPAVATSIGHVGSLVNNIRAEGRWKLVQSSALLCRLCRPQHRLDL
jgi:hypothetical protein